MDIVSNFLFFIHIPKKLCCTKVESPMKILTKFASKYLPKSKILRQLRYVDNFWPRASIAEAVLRKTWVVVIVILVVLVISLLSNVSVFVSLHTYLYYGKIFLYLYEIKLAWLKYISIVGFVWFVVWKYIFCNYKIQ